METLDRTQLAFVHKFVRFAPIIVQFIIFFNILDEWILGTSFTNFLYPLIGHSLLFDFLLLALSKALKYCLWHRILIYNMIFNISLEWIYVNIPVFQDYNSMLVISALSTGIACVTAFILRVLLTNYNSRNEFKNS